MFERDAVTSPEEPFARLAWEVCFGQRKSVRSPEFASREIGRSGRHSRTRGGKSRYRFREERDRGTWVIYTVRRKGSIFIYF